MLLSRLEQLVAGQPLETDTAWYAVDESRWPRCDAETSGSAGRLTSSHPPVPWSAHRRGLELLLAGAGSRTLLQLDRPAPSASHDAGGKRQRGWQQNRFAPSCPNAGAANRVPSSPLMLAISPVQLGVALAELDVSAPVASPVWSVNLSGSTTGTDWRASAAAWGQIRL
jgi:hypothetical protein